MRFGAPLSVAVGILVLFAARLVLVFGAKFGGESWNGLSLALWTLRYVIAKLREMLLGHPMVSPDKLHVRFNGFGAYSLDVERFAYIRTPDWLEYRAVREDINFRIIDIVNESGSGFAFPSQTTYHGRDSGLDAERTSKAEATAAERRSKSQLPFPEFDPALQWEKEGLLDYPPRGSSHYTPRPGITEPPQDNLPQHPSQMPRNPA